LMINGYLMGLIFALASALMYSLASILYRVALDDVDPLLVTAIRAIPALLVVLLVNYIIGEIAYLSMPTLDIVFYGFLAGSMGMMLGAYFYMKALKFGGVSIGFPTAFSYPVFVSIIASMFLNERFTAGILLGLISTLSGITILALSNSDSNSTLNPLKGAINGLMASILWALSIIVSKLALEFYPPIPFATIRLFFASLLAVPMLAVNNKWNTLKPTGLFVISFGGVLGIGFGIIFAHIALTYIGATVSAIASASSPALSIILAALILREKASKGQLIGVILVIIGTALTFL